MVTLSNGRYSVRLNASGSGLSCFDDIAVTRGLGDAIEDTEGLFVFLRDPQSGLFWSAGHQPVRRVPDRYAAAVDDLSCTITRLDHDVETTMQVFVTHGRNAEVRRIRLRNGSSVRRRIEITTYAEIVLLPAAADAAHPAFRKLFLQSEFEPSTQSLLVSRRPRSASERRLWAVHALRGPGPLEYETDRMRFVGRGRSLRFPAALNGVLSGTIGNVLDPITSLRRTLDLDPGETIEAILLLGVTADRDEAVDLARWFCAADPLTIPAAAISAGADLPTHSIPVRTGAEKRPAVVPSRSSEPPRDGEPLLSWNGHGGFAADGREYVIRIRFEGDSLRLPPLPWINVIANENFGFLASETGAGCTWSRNSRKNRLTPWFNDPVLDPHGEAIYVRDEETGRFWSALPGPAPRSTSYEVRHGFGYSRFEHNCEGLSHDVVTFVARNSPVKITRLRLTNHGGHARKLSIFTYQRLVLGELAADCRAVATAWDASRAALFVRNPQRGEFSNGVVFAALSTFPAAAALHYSGDRASFIGLHGDPSEPAALLQAQSLDGRTGVGFDPCAALQASLTLESGQTLDCIALLGEATVEEHAHTLVERYRNPHAVEQALREVRDFWNQIVSSIEVETPSAAINLMLNGWLLYQTLACRLWARAAFYQSGGAFGFRDQLQDATALVYARPAWTREQILLHAAHQFVEGDVLHWWHPPADKGMRTRFSDDLLWLPYVALFYAHTTGDWGIFDEQVPFVCARLLDPGEDETYVKAEPSRDAASVYEHCCRAIDRSLTAGAHGLPLMGTGDWNDGMNRVGREGRGESVWLAFFLFDILGDFIELAKRRGDTGRAKRCAAYRARLERAIETAGWDGNWYRRAYYDDGTPLGSAQNEECRIDVLAQAWAVISGAADRECGARAMRAAEELLFDTAAGLVRLLAPPFDRTAQDPGYIKGYVPGLRENGGQYTHAALWAVQAMAELGWRDRAARYLEMLTPVRHAATEEACGVYRVEPYVVAADICGVAPHVGRGGWTWYTGSAGWMYRIVLESILGFRSEEGRTIVTRPCIPDHWSGFRIRYRLPGSMTRYDIDVANPSRCSAAVVRASFNGEPVSIIDGAARIPLLADGEVHTVTVVLGAG